MGIPSCGSGSHSTYSAENSEINSAKMVTTLIITLNRC